LFLTREPDSAASVIAIDRKLANTFNREWIEHGSRPGNYGSIDR